MQYFEHSTHAADDDKIMALRIGYGGAAVDCYWAILEKMYRDEEPLRLFGTEAGTNPETDTGTKAVTNPETKAVSHRLNISETELETYVSAMIGIGLFGGDVENLYSERAMQNIEAYRQKAETARQNGKGGGRKPKPKPRAKPRAKPTGTDAETDAETGSVATKQNKTKDIGLDKTKPISSASGGADAAGAAPPSAIECERCGVPMRPTSAKVAGTDRRYWRCPLCGEEVAL